jgi:hypothetical protein
MARSHARIFTSIWDDADFLALSGNAQRFYLMLLSQPNLGHAGVLPTTVRRWTLLSADEDEGQLRTAMDELAAARFVMVDERTEELLIRSLIRNDGVWKQPKVLAVAISEAASIRSATLRSCVADELCRLDDLSSLPETTRPAVEALLKELPDRLANAHLELAEHGGKHPPADPPPHPPAEPGPDEGADVLRVRAHAAPTPATIPYPGPVPPPADAAPPRVGRKPRASSNNAGDVIAAFVEGATAAGCDRPGEAIRKRVGRDAVRLLGEGFPLERLVDSARRMGATPYNDLAVQLRKDDPAAQRGNGPKQTNYSDEEYESGF